MTQALADNKELVRRRFDEIFDRANLEACDETVARRASSTQSRHSAATSLEVWATGDDLTAMSQLGVIRPPALPSRAAS